MSNCDKIKLLNFNSQDQEKEKNMVLGRETSEMSNKELTTLHSLLSINNQNIKTQERGMVGGIKMNEINKNPLVNSNNGRIMVDEPNNIFMVNKTIENPLTKQHSRVVNGNQVGFNVVMRDNQNILQTNVNIQEKEMESGNKMNPLINSNKEVVVGEPINILMVGKTIQNPISKQQPHIINETQVDSGVMNILQSHLSLSKRDLPPQNFDEKHTRKRLQHNGNGPTIIGEQSTYNHANGGNLIIQSKVPPQIVFLNGTGMNQNKDNLICGSSGKVKLLSTPYVNNNNNGQINTIPQQVNEMSGGGESNFHRVTDNLENFIERIVEKKLNEFVDNITKNWINKKMELQLNDQFEEKIFEKYEKNYELMLDKKIDIIFQKKHKVIEEKIEIVEKSKENEMLKLSEETLKNFDNKINRIIEVCNNKINTSKQVSYTPHMKSLQQTTSYVAPNTNQNISYLGNVVNTNYTPPPLEPYNHSPHQNQYISQSPHFVNQNVTPPPLSQYNNNNPTPSYLYQNHNQYSQFGSGRIEQPQYIDYSQNKPTIPNYQNSLLYQQNQTLQFNGEKTTSPLPLQYNNHQYIQRKDTLNAMTTPPLNQYNTLYDQIRYPYTSGVTNTQQPLYNTHHMKNNDYNIHNSSGSGDKILGVSNLYQQNQLLQFTNENVRPLPQQHNNNFYQTQSGNNVIRNGIVGDNLPPPQQHNNNFYQTQSGDNVIRNDIVDDNLIQFQYNKYPQEKENGSKIISGSNNQII